MDKVYLPSQLSQMDLPKLPLAVFGKPIVHSLSPIMQNAALKFLGEYDTSKYYKFEVAPEDLGKTLPLFFDRNFLGINLTIPLKEQVFDYIENVDELSKKCGACNTLRRTKTGWEGFNTDGFGIESSLKTNFGKSFFRQDVLIYGAGGAAKGASFAAAYAGARKIYIANRTYQKADSLAKSLRDNGFNASVYTDSWAGKINIIINATSLGLKEGDLPICDFSQFEKNAVFCDMVYSANNKTVSEKAALQCGIKSCSGLSMLAWQGAKSLQIWFGFNNEVLFKVGKLMEQTLKDYAK